MEGKTKPLYHRGRLHAAIGGWNSRLAAGVYEVLHFGFQTAIVSVVRGRRGLLDAGDLILHTYHRRAEEVRAGDLPYRSHAVRVLCWPAK